MFSIMLMLNYLLTVFLFFMCMSNFSFWVIMEVNMLSFLLYSSSMYSNGDSMLSISGMYYFMVQSLGSILFLFSVSQELSVVSFSFTNDVLFLASVSIKIGLFPFYSWFIFISSTLLPYPLLFLLTIQKIPILAFLYSVNSAYLITFLIFCLAFGCLTMLESSHMISLLILSSVYSSYWLFLLYSLDFYYFFFYFLLYFLFLVPLILPSSVSTLPSFFSYLFFLGLPPVSMFFLKFSIVEYLYTFCSMWEFLFFWICIFLATVGYSKHFYSGFFTSSLLSLHHVFRFNLVSFLFYLGVFSVFLIF